MNAVKFDNTWFTIPGHGIGYNDKYLTLEVLAEDTSVDQMEELLTPVPELIEIYADDRVTKTGEFKGYTILSSLMKGYGKLVLQDVKEDTITIEFRNPELEEKVDKNEAQTFYTAMMTDTLLEEDE